MIRFPLFRGALEIDDEAIAKYAHDHPWIDVVAAIERLAKRCRERARYAGTPETARHMIDAELSRMSRRTHAGR